MDAEKYRAAARGYCTKVGIDPDATIEDDEAPGFAFVTNYRWVIEARKMFRLNTMLECLESHGFRSRNGVT